MNILLINHYAGSPRHGMEYRPYYLAREWVKLGHKVKILAGSYSHVRSNQPSYVSGDCALERIDNIDFYWYKTPAYFGNGLGRIMSMILFIWKVWKDAKKIAKSFKPDVVIASSTYPMDIWPAERISKFCCAQLVYEVHDLWPLSPIELGGMSRWHPFIIWVQCAEDYAYKVADRVVSLLPKTFDYMRSRGMRDDKWDYVPNGVCLDDWRSFAPLPDSTNSVLLSVKKRGLPIVVYAGSHGLANSLDTLLDASTLLQGKVELLLVGTGPERHRLMRRVSSENLTNVTMLPSIPKAAIPALLDQIDFAFLGLQPQPLFRFGISPNKLFDYMMAGKPIIQSINAGNDIVSEVGCGFTVMPNDSKAIVQAVDKLLKLTKYELLEMGNAGKSFVKNERSYEFLAKKMISILEK
ncbi:putative glycosyl transferase [Synechococcus sp. MIT S9509]|uniref:glycosyltransferase family 4 protein n=1 Tax=Synechococcus sp. MIT S9509 TaxID=1801630 RepID=UPI0007BC139A|nr:glycosyltransferase family 4 protein [Synechococcus sp. MIT S9509]KZR93745.1 putative glycosyl transferase [Synechococcus sp. MIT S9509]